MREKEYVIKDAQGIHARPAGQLVKLAQEYPCSITVTNKGKEADAKRILGVMSLGAKCGESIVIKCEGENEDNAIEAIVRFLEENM